MGDFNVNILASTTIKSNYLNLLRSFGYDVTNDKVTRPMSNSVIDHVITNFLLDANYTISNELSDHCSILAHFMFDNTSLDVSLDYREVKLVNFDQVNELLVSDLYEHSPNFGNDAIERFNYLVTTMKFRVSQCTKISIVKIRKNEKCPWMDDRVRKLCDLKKRMLRTLRRRPLDEILKMRIRNLEGDIRARMRILKKAYFEQRFKTCKNTRETWKELNKVLGRRSSATVVKRLLNTKRNTILSHNSEIASYFNEYFSTIGRDLKGEVPSVNDQGIKNLSWNDSP